MAHYRNPRQGQAAAAVAAVAGEGVGLAAQAPGRPQGAPAVGICASLQSTAGFGGGGGAGGSPSGFLSERISDAVAADAGGRQRPQADVLAASRAVQEANDLAARLMGLTATARELPPASASQGGAAGSAARSSAAGSATGSAGPCAGGGGGSGAAGASGRRDGDAGAGETSRPSTASGERGGALERPPADDPRGPSGGPYADKGADSTRGWDSGGAGPSGAEEELSQQEWADEQLLRLVLGGARASGQEPPFPAPPKWGTASLDTSPVKAAGAAGGGAGGGAGAGGGMRALFAAREGGSDDVSGAGGWAETMSAQDMGGGWGNGDPSSGTYLMGGGAKVGGDGKAPGVVRNGRYMR